MNAVSARPLRAHRRILDAVGHELLADVAAECGDQLAASVAFYERDGEFALELQTSGWCRVLRDRPRERGALVTKPTETMCHACSWDGASLDCMRAAAPIDYPCPGGRTIYAVPIHAGGAIAGTLVFGYGAPPRDPEKIRAVAERFDVPVEQLARQAVRYAPPDEGLVRAARRHVDTAARLVGALIDRDRAEQDRDRLRGLFLGMIGHDLRSPLSTILLAAGTAAGSPEPRVAHAGRAIDRAGRRMRELIEQVLDLTRSQLGGGIPIHVAPVDLGEVALETVEEVQLAHPGQRIDADITPGCLCDCDAGRISQVLANLLGNAVCHGRGGSIRVWLRPAADDDGVELGTQNLGPPIPPDLLPVIFEPFQRDRDPSKGCGGLGLGLFIAREIVIAHGGEIDVRSTAEEGTTFIVHLPRAPSRS